MTSQESGSLLYINGLTHKSLHNNLFIDRDCLVQKEQRIYTDLVISSPCDQVGVLKQSKVTPGLFLGILAAPL